MAEPQFAQPMDDDLPRTVRRERDARQARLHQQQHAASGGYSTGPQGAGTPDHPPGEGVVVSALEVPFFRLMAFLLKVVLAGIPALILLGLILYSLGQVAQTYFPWLVKMRIIITFPQA
jgi:hypothetical protein